MRYCIVLACALVALTDSVSATNCTQWTTQCITASEHCSQNVMETVFPGAQGAPGEKRTLKLCPDNYDCEDGECTGGVEADRKRISDSVAKLRANYTQSCTSDAACCAPGDEDCPLSCLATATAGRRCVLSNGRQVLGDLCAYDEECSSGWCQDTGRCHARSVTPAYGNCTGGATQCADGHFCSSAREACVPKLPDGAECDNMEQGAQCAGAAVCTTVWTENQPSRKCRGVRSLPARTVFEAVLDAGLWLCLDGFMAVRPDGKNECLSRMDVENRDGQPCDPTTFSSDVGFKCACLPDGTGMTIPASVTPFLPGDPTAKDKAATLLAAIGGCARSHVTQIALSANDCVIRRLGQKNYCDLFPYASPGNAVLSLTKTDIDAINVPACAVDPLAEETSMGGTVTALKAICEGHVEALCSYQGPLPGGAKQFSVCLDKPPVPDSPPKHHRWTFDPTHVAMVVAAAVIVVVVVVAVVVITSRRNASHSGDEEHREYSTMPEYVPPHHV